MFHCDVRDEPQQRALYPPAVLWWICNVDGLGIWQRSFQMRNGGGSSFQVVLLWYVQCVLHVSHFEEVRRFNLVFVADTIYTERYMMQPSENPDFYAVS